MCVSTLYIVFIDHADVPEPILEGVEFWRNGILISGNGFVDNDIGTSE